MAPRRTKDNPYGLVRVRPVEKKSRKVVLPEPPAPDLKPGDLVEVNLRPLFWTVPTPTRVVSIEKMEWTKTWWRVNIETSIGVRGVDSSLVSKWKG